MTTTELTSALLVPFLDPASRTWWGSLLVSAVIAGVFWWRVRPDWRLSGVWTKLSHPSSVLDIQLLIARQLLGLLFTTSAVAGAWLLATHAVRQMDAAFGVPSLPEIPDAVVSGIFSLTLFVCWDGSRWVLHWLLHRVPRLWQLHQVHHSAEVLTPLTFHRIHPLESMLYQLRSLVVTGTVTALFFWLFRTAAIDITLLGVSALGLVLNMATGNLRHSHVWLRFPSAVERWLLSPAQHQLHHSADPAHHGANYGTWLALWDRWAGTLIIEDTPPTGFGLSEPNHDHNLLSAWFSPLRAVLMLLALLVVVPAHAQDEEADDSEDPEDPEDPEEDEGDYGLQMIVYGEDGTPRVAGSAHAIDEETLALFEYDNIERVLLAVPGVNTRSEDGFGLRPNIGIRGASSDRSAKLTLMEDGVLLAPAPYAAPAAYYFPMSTRMVGIEVFKGPAATRYGPHTVGGAINMLTREIPSVAASALDVSAGMWQSVKAHGHVGTTGRAGGVLLEGVQLHSGGFKELDGGGDTGFDRTELMLKTRRVLTSHQRLELKLGYARETSNETYLGLSATDYAAAPYRRYSTSSEGLMAWNRTQAELAWAVIPNKDLQIRTVAYHHWMDRSWTKFNRFASDIDIHDLMIDDSDSGQAAVYLAILRGEEDSTSDEQTILVGTNRRTFHSFGLQSTARLTSYGERTSSVLEGGMRLHGDDVVRLHTEDPFDMTGGTLIPTGDATETTLDSHATAAALATFLHEDFRIDDLHILPGIRLEVVRTDRLDTVDDPVDDPVDPVTRANVLPALGVLYGLTNWVDVFAGAYRGFSPVAPGQPEEVSPELSWNYEAGIRTVQGDRHIEVVGFFNDYTNLTGQCTLSGGCDTDQLDQQFNGGAAWIYGVETVVGHTVLLPGEMTIPLAGTFTWTESAFQTGFTSSFDQFGTVEIGDSLPYSPRLQASGNLTLAHPRGSLGAGVSWHGGMLDEAGIWPDDLTADGHIPPLLLLDAALHANLTDSISLYATGTNLTGSTAITSWRPLGARPTAPRTVMFGIKAAR